MLQNAHTKTVPKVIHPVLLCAKMCVVPSDYCSFRAKKKKKKKRKLPLKKLADIEQLL